jgi:hypothetical protein
MSYYAFSADIIQRLTRVFWGSKSTQPDGTKKDSGVQEFSDEIIAALSSQDPIKLNSSIDLIAPETGPSIRIWGDGDQIHIINNEGDVTTVNITNTTTGGGGTGGATGTATVLTGVSVGVSLAGVTIDTSGLSINISVSGCTVTATLTGTATLSGSPTVTVTPTTGNLIFTDGAYQGGP